MAVLLQIVPLFAGQLCRHSVIVTKAAMRHDGKLDRAHDARSESDDRRNAKPLARKLHGQLLSFSIRRGGLPMPIRFVEPTPTRGCAPSHAPPDVHYAPGLTVAKALGWFSIGLGVAEWMRPHSVARVAHVRPGLLKRTGLREIACGIGILASERPTRWIWGRVVGDGLDLISLAEALAETKARKASVWGSVAVVAGVTALDVACATALTAAEQMEG
jgi:hypothetical protein